MSIKYFIYIFLHFCTLKINAEDLEFCENVENGECMKKSEIIYPTESHFFRKRYILYDVNPPEGFNLRRDVYVRVATFVKRLVEEDKEYQWRLVLPPWGNLYHWRSNDIGPQEQIPWNVFFDIESLKRYIPILEMHEFMKEVSSKNKETVIDCVYILKNDEEMFKTGNFIDKNVVSDCPKNSIPYKISKNDNKRLTGYFWGYKNISTYNVKCITFHGTTLDLRINLQPNLYRSVMFDHMEIPMHYGYGSVEYWKARRSMRYNIELYEIANEFRDIYLNSNDLDDNTHKPHDWRLEEKKRYARGGPYLAIHFRRKDFIIGRPESTPTVESAVHQMDTILKLLNLDTVFVATDTEEKEYIQLSNKLKSLNYTVYRFLPTMTIKNKFKDGGIAIIDQIICSHSRYFIGTYESTFTFRIQEDREILGFPSNTTFNRFCVKNNKCHPGSRWEIVWN